MVHSILPAGTFREQFYAQQAGEDIVTDGSSWHPIIMPAGKKYVRLLIQCQKETPSFDFDSDLTSFRISSHPAGPGEQAPRAGVIEPVEFGPHESDKIVKYVWAPAGYKILCSLMS